MMNLFLAHEFGYPLQKNVFWTATWICLTIISWKYIGAKALIPYPIFVLVSLITQALLPFNITKLVILSLENIGGLILFSIYYRKSEKKFLLEQQKQSSATTDLKTNKTIAPTNNVEKKYHHNTNISYTRPKRNNELKENTKNTNAYTQPKQQNNSPSKPLIIEEEIVDKFYTNAFDEYESKNFDKTVMAKAIAASAGDPNKERSTYIRMRVQVLSERYLDKKREQLENERKKELKKHKELQRIRQEELVKEKEKQKQLENAPKEERDLETMKTLKGCWSLLDIKDRESLYNQYQKYSSLLTDEEKKFFSEQLNLLSNSWTSLHNIYFVMSFVALAYNHGVDAINISPQQGDELNRIIKLLPNNGTIIQPESINTIISNTLSR